MDSQLEGLKFDSAGLIPAIVQDHKTAQVLMMAWMNRDAFEETVLALVSEGHVRRAAN